MGDPPSETGAFQVNLITYLVVTVMSSARFMGASGTNTMTSPLPDSEGGELP
jgi:hypothetical protein